MSGIFTASIERRLLQGAVAIAALVPLLAGLTVMIAGPASLIPTAADSGLDLDSHIRYLSGLLFAIGLAFLSAIPRIESRGARFRLLTGVVFIGGLGRLASLAAIGVPSTGMVAGLAMELLVTPLIALWRERVERRMR